jgi:hypothetical protein
LNLIRIGTNIQYRLANGEAPAYGDGGRMIPNPAGLVDRRCGVIEAAKCAGEDARRKTSADADLGDIGVM